MWFLVSVSTVDQLALSIHWYSQGPIFWIWYAGEEIDSKELARSTEAIPQTTKNLIHLSGGATSSAEIFEIKILFSGEHSRPNLSLWPIIGVLGVRQITPLAPTVNSQRPLIPLLLVKQTWLKKILNSCSSLRWSCGKLRGWPKPRRDYSLRAQSPQLQILHQKR